LYKISIFFTANLYGFTPLAMTLFFILTEMKLNILKIWSQKIDFIKLQINKVNILSHIY